jgi:hypothetical protein
MNSTNEEWRVVANYPDYEVSTLGRVRSKARKNPIIVKPAKDRAGYLHITLARNGKKKTYNIHRLVMITFVGKRPDGQQIRQPIMMERKTDTAN